MYQHHTATPEYFGFLGIPGPTGEGRRSGQCINIIPEKSFAANQQQ
jgi:hypothetical protein